jgi:1,4-dihydroxy-2-naphthoyl-CoA hydrolase
VGMTITAVHHRPASSGSVTGVGTVLAVGRTTATIAIAISDDAGRRVCSCTLLCQLRDAPPQQA